MQEAREQVIIEQSIKICEESNTVIAKYPFLKDPVEFLTAMALITKSKPLEYTGDSARRVRSKKKV